MVSILAKYANWVKKYKDKNYDINPLDPDILLPLHGPKSEY